MPPAYVKPYVKRGKTDAGDTVLHREDYGSADECFTVQGVPPIPPSPLQYHQSPKVGHQQQF
jgi:hypothetical protein